MLQLLIKFLYKYDFGKKLPMAVSMLTLFLTFDCATPVRKIQNGCSVVEGGKPIQDMFLETMDRKGRLIMASQDRSSIDPREEYMEIGSINFINLSGSYESEIHEFKIRGRDEFPFHPSRVHVGKLGKKNLLVVLNRALRGVNVIEIFQMTNAELVFQTRIRGEAINNATDIFASDAGTIYAISPGNGFFRGIRTIVGNSYTSMVVIKLEENSNLGNVRLAEQNILGVKGTFDRFVDIIPSDGEWEQEIPDKFVPATQLLSETDDGVFSITTAGDTMAIAKSVNFENIRFADGLNGGVAALSYLPVPGDAIAENENPRKIRMSIFGKFASRSDLIIDEQPDGGFPSVFKVFEGRVFWGYSNRSGLRICAVNQ